MSINSLTDIEINKIATQQNATLAATGGTAPNAAPPNNTLSALVKYIPTESVTLYVAAISAAPALKSISWLKITEVNIYWFFGVLTPLLFALIFLGKLRAASLWPLKSLKDWPWWKNIAAAVAFLVWALAVPGPPDIKGDTSGAIAALFALFISTVLSILEPIFDRTPDA
jgi:hypothetical protein